MFSKILLLINMPKLIKEKTFWVYVE